MTDVLLHYFPSLSPEQVRRFSLMPELYEHWNSKINVVSRKDIHNLMIHHVLHSLAIARFMSPVDGTEILDLGTGGGFPGIPLAIMWPHCRMHLIDRIGKKLHVASEVASALGLDNVTFQHGDIGECHMRFDFTVSRAVMELSKLLPLIRKNISSQSRNSLPNGLVCLKGGDLSQEIASSQASVLQVPLTDYFDEEYFSTKSLLYCPI